MDDIDQDPANFETRRIYADWLEENGNPLARGWRWLNERGRVPDHCSPHNSQERWTFWMEYLDWADGRTVIEEFYCPFSPSPFWALKFAAQEHIRING